MDKTLKLALFAGLAGTTVLTGCTRCECGISNGGTTPVVVDGGGNGGGGDSGGDLPTACSETFVSCSSDGQTAFVSGVIDKDFTLSTDLNWVLDGGITVGQGNALINNEAEAQAIRDNGVRLTVPAGSDIRATEDAVLIVTRGSQLVANGTADDPITFSSADEDFDGLGEWGGIVIQGFASQFGQGGTGACFGDAVPPPTFCNVEGEGTSDVARYGGSLDDDNSGILRYVRIAEGGLVAGPNNEVNGLTLQGVGHGTTIEYVQVHNNLDDAVEWFGGTVNAKWLVLTGTDDDDIDYDEGYRGNIQYAIIVKSDNATPQGTNDPRGIEANSSDEDFTPETEAALANIAVLGGAVNNSDGAQEPGMRLRGALTTTVYNTVLKDWDTGCIRIDDADTDGDGTNDQFSNVSLVNVVGDCQDGFYDRRDADSELNSGPATVVIDDAYAYTDGGNVSIPGAPVDNGSGFVFEAADFIGAVRPGTTRDNAWWAGWTIPGSL